MRLLNLVEKDDAIRLAAHSLGQLAALVVAHISRRRSDETRHTVPLLVLAHIDTHHHVLIVEHHLGKGSCQLGLTHARGTEEEEGAYRAAAVAQTRAAAAYGVGDGADGLVLTHHTLVQLVLQVEQPLALALQHPRHGDARPL